MIGGFVLKSISNTLTWVRTCHFDELSVIWALSKFQSSTGRLITNASYDVHFLIGQFIVHLHLVRYKSNFVRQGGLLPRWGLVLTSSICTFARLNKAFCQGIFISFWFVYERSHSQEVTVKPLAPPADSRFAHDTRTPRLPALVCGLFLTDRANQFSEKKKEDYFTHVDFTTSSDKYVRSRMWQDILLKGKCHFVMPHFFNRWLVSPFCTVYLRLLSTTRGQVHQDL